MKKTPLAVQLAEFVARLRFEELPPAVVDKAKAFVNHAVTVGLVGADNARTAAARRAVIEHESLGPRRVGAGQGATLWVDGTRVTNPTLIVWGREDRIVPVECGEQYRRLLPNARLTVLERCGHLPPIEQPDAFARLVVDFLGGDTRR